MAAAPVQLKRQDLRLQSGEIHDSHAETGTQSTSWVPCSGGSRASLALTPPQRSPGPQGRETGPGGTQRLVHNLGRREGRWEVASAARGPDVTSSGRGPAHPTQIERSGGGLCCAVLCCARCLFLEFHTSVWPAPDHMSGDHGDRLRSPHPAMLGQTDGLSQKVRGMGCAEPLVCPYW